MYDTLKLRLLSYKGVGQAYTTTVITPSRVASINTYLDVNQNILILAVLKCVLVTLPYNQNGLFHYDGIVTYTISIIFRQVAVLEP